MLYVDNSPHHVIVTVISYDQGLWRAVSLRTLVSRISVLRITESWGKLVWENDTELTSEREDKLLRHGSSLQTMRVAFAEHCHDLSGPGMDLGLAFCVVLRS